MTSDPYAWAATGTASCVAIMWLVAASEKLLGPAGIRAALTALGVPLPDLMVRGLVLYEMCLGVGLLSGVLPAAFMLLSVVTLIGFGMTTVWLRAHGIRGCNCFGDASSHPTSAVNVMARNLAISGALGGAYAARAQAHSALVLPKWLPLVAVGGALVAVSVRRSLLRARTRRAWADM
jgi:hypothetical protein